MIFNPNCSSRASFSLKIRPKLGPCPGNLVVVGVIEAIKHFRPELHIHSLRDIGVLEDREVNRLKARSKNNVAPAVAKGPIRGWNEATRIEKSENGLLTVRQIAIASPIKSWQIAHSYLELDHQAGSV